MQKYNVNFNYFFTAVATVKKREDIGCFLELDLSTVKTFPPVERYCGGATLFAKWEELVELTPFYDDVTPIDDGVALVNPLAYCHDGIVVNGSFYTLDEACAISRAYHIAVTKAYLEDDLGISSEESLEMAAEVRRRMYKYNMSESEATEKIIEEYKEGK